MKREEMKPLVDKFVGNDTFEDKVIYDRGAFFEYYKIEKNQENETVYHELMIEKLRKNSKKS